MGFLCPGVVELQKRNRKITEKKWKSNLDNSEEGDFPHMFY